MNSIKNKVFFPDASRSISDLDEYYLRDKTFGHFEDNGRVYVVTERETPRPWIQYLCNNKIRCAVSNTGMGFIYHKNDVYITKYYELENYIARNVNGKRELFVEFFDDDKVYEFFTESDDFTCYVTTGFVLYKGNVKNLNIEVKIFVPQNDPCECWNIQIFNNGNSNTKFNITAKQDLYLYNDYYIPSDVGVVVKNGIRSVVCGLINLFNADKVDNVHTEEYTETPAPDKSYKFLTEKISAAFEIECNNTVKWNIVSSACRNEIEEEEIKKYLNDEECSIELSKINTSWDDIIAKNYCSLPDKNLEYFLNVWLKYQLYVTFRYDRGIQFCGFRDGLQDSWGYLLVEPNLAKEKILFCLSNMLKDGRCPRNIDLSGRGNHMMDDFADSPTWAPLAINSYIKETNDFSILSEKIRFLDSDEETTVEEHIYLSLDYLYNSRGKNGLILMRDGDWADGLGGINKYGQGATSVWMTIATFYAQNKMKEIYEEIGFYEKAKIMETRSAEYKRIVNDVGWDGNWFVYAFFEDGEPIGASKNLEGKIWLNPQTWAMFSGIVDSEDKIKRIRRSISRYLNTPYGAMVNYPPYVFYGERCGRIQRQHPGTFLNSSIYNHAASFKVFSDVKISDYVDFYDTISRCLPNHPDNSDTRRTSEPFTVGNVYYGPDSGRYGMNLFSWFTATPAWLIHGGFEEILGVKAEFNGLKLEPHVSEDWEEYKVEKLYRNTLYTIEFKKDVNEKGIWVDGIKQDCNIIKSSKEKCCVVVKY